MFKNYFNIPDDYHLDLQRFAEESTNTTGATESQAQQVQEKTENNNKDQQEDQGKNETLEKAQEMIKKMQSNFDKVNTEKQKLLKDLESEKKKTLSDKQIKELEEQEIKNKMESQARELAEKTLLFEKSKLLFEKQWDAEYLDIVSGQDVESFQTNVEKLDKKIKKLVEKEVNERLGSAAKVPEKKSTEGQDIFTAEELQTLPKKMGTEWTIKNMEKIDRSMKFYNTK